MRILLLLIFLLSTQLTFSQSAKSFWQEKIESTIHLLPTAKRQIIPQKYRSVEFDIEELKHQLKTAPNWLNASKSSVEIDLPLPDGSSDRFEVWESPVMMSGLAAKYPEIKTFKIRSIAHPSHIGRIGYTHTGFHGTIDTEQGQVYIDPFATQQTQNYISYYTKEHVDSTRHESFTCDVPHEDELEYLAHMADRMRAHQANTAQRSVQPTEIRNYRLALATTAEYSVFHGSTTADVMSAVVICLNRANGIFEREIGVHLNLIDGTDQLFFFNAVTDGFTNGNTEQMIQQNPTVVNGVFSPNDYDIGHVFGTNAGGLAQLASVCTNGKARGVTCHGNPIGDNFYIDYVCHEMGHQFGGPHTFNKCDGENENTGTAFEPGSGSTIMSYSGLCGINNLQFSSDEYYNIGALELMTFNMQEGVGSTCAEEIPTMNNTPVANIPFEGNFFIPINTPFELEGGGTDEDGDEIRYCWEQYDTGPLADVGSPILNSPIVRSYSPTTANLRIVPRLSNLLNNSFNFGENLPTYSRDMTFRLTVRDYDMQAGGADWDEVKFKATDTAGPFRVQYPSALDIEMEVGDFVEVRWDVANTDNSKVNCQNVDIYLSTNGGNAFPILLAENTANDGSEYVLIPDNITNTARIKIKAADNIFFDVSNTNFKILAPTTPGYSLATSPTYQQVCLPNTASVSLETASLLEYDSLISYTVVDGLPNGAEASFTANPSTPSDGSVLDVDMSNVTEEGTYEVLLQATAPSTDTAYRTIIFEVVSNDFEALAISTPTAGEQGVSTLPFFTWITVAAANTYSIEIATSPTFGDSIVDSAEGIVAGEYSPSITFDESTPYYWRVFPVNECGKGTPLLTNSFHTVSFTCATENSVDTPVNISGSGAPTIESKINVFADGIINDINIPIFKGNHEWFSDLAATLTSPAGTEVTLFSGKCSNYNGNFSFGLDDQAPISFECPPNAASFKPQQSLSAFIGESTAGLWTLRLKDSQGGSGGQLIDWQLEFCASVNTTPPVLVNNIEMSVNPNDGRNLANEFLLTEDPNNEEWELIYTLVDVPQKGTMTLDSEALIVGSEFTQSDIHWGSLRYTHSSGDNTLDTDNFRFTVRDNEGGWIGTPQFNILIDPEAIVATQEVEEDKRIKLFPNPATDKVQIQFEDMRTSRTHISLIDVKGQHLQQKIHLFEADMIELSVSDLPAGVYFLKFQLEDTVLYKKLIVE